ncbi:RABP2 protein, partial [Polypterus senegalus]
MGRKVEKVLKDKGDKGAPVSEEDGTRTAEDYQCTGILENDFPELCNLIDMKEFPLVTPRPRPTVTSAIDKSVLGWKIDDRMIRVFNKCLPSLSSLQGIKKVVLEGTPIPSQAYALLISEESVLTHLSLRNNKIDEVGAKLIGQALSTPKLANKNLTSLNLAYNHIEDAGALYIAKGLRLNRALLCLNLSHNQIGDQGAMKLAEPLFARRADLKGERSLSHSSSISIDRNQKTKSAAKKKDKVYRLAPVTSLSAGKKRSVMERKIPNFAGNWKMKSSENFDELLKALGVNVMLRKIAVAAASKPAVEIRQDGETFYIKTSTTVRTTEINFTVGEEFDEQTVDGRPCKSMPKWDGENRIKCEQTLLKEGPKTSWTRELTNDERLILDPAVIQHTANTGYATLDLYNPFDNNQGPPPPYEQSSQKPPLAVQTTAQPTAPPQPKKSTPTEPRNYGTQGPVNAATADLLRKQEELERKAAELDRREKELQNASLGKDTSELDHIQSDSSFNFFVFFFIFFVQVVLYVLQAIGIPGWGFSGWIASLSALKLNTAVAIIMLITAVMFTGQAVLGVVMLKKIHSIYRQSGASFQKAQAEFASGVLSNEAVRTAAANAAANAATGAAQGAFQAK